MNRIRGGAVVLGLALLAASSAAHAQETTGRVTGRVTDKDTGAALGGVTVIMQGPQGQDATITDDAGEYRFTTLPVGTYVVRFYAANASTQVEQSGIVVSADKTVRVNAKVAGAAQAAAQQTYVISGKAPAVDVGSTRVGAQFDEQFTKGIPLGRTYGDVISHAPGVFFDGSGNISIGGATGLENIYVVNGMNVTGLDYGSLETGNLTIGGGTNLPLEFLTQIDVNSGGYQAEHGGAMGGVINSVLKSGSNEFHGSAFGYWSPFWMSANPKVVTPVGSAIGDVRKPDYDDSIGVEVGGPLIKNKLFFWLGFAPRLTQSHVQQLYYAQQEDLNNPGNPVLGANGLPQTRQLPLSEQPVPIQEYHRSYSYAGTLDFIPLPDHHLTLTVIGTPSFNDQVSNGRTLSNTDFIGDTKWPSEQLTKVNTDVNAHWTSKLFDHHWQIDALAGVHNEYYNDRSPYAALNGENQLVFQGSNLYSLQGVPDCMPATDGFNPCPVGFSAGPYNTGGFGLTTKYSGTRWTGEIKSTNSFEAGGHHELKYGWHLEYATFDQDHSFSGPNGDRALVQVAPDNSINTINFYSIPPGLYQSSFGPSGSGSTYPYTDLLYGPYYKDVLHADVSSLSNAFFLQDSYSPAVLRNLTVNVGARLEIEKMYDFHGTSFLDTNNFGPRLGAIFDPMNDGRSKISVSYGRYFEAVPLNIAVRYFGGEGFLSRSGTPSSQCANSNPYTWTGAGEWRACNVPPMSTASNPNPPDNAVGGESPANNGSTYPVQSNLQGQYQNEVVATYEREIMDGMTARIDYQHRWLGTIIEDGAADPSLTNVLANPGNIPQSDIDSEVRYLNQLTAAAMAQPGSAQLAASIANEQAKIADLKALQAVPKPERTYDAVTLSLNKRFSNHWLTRASYTYSRLVGNYEGLYQAEQNYFAPNGGNAYDTPDLYLNQNGRLPNDRPHNFRLDGLYTTDVGKGRISFGLSFNARSGMPRNYISGLIPGQEQELVMLLPRGSGGRTPTVTQLDGKIAYGRPISPGVGLELFLDLFNIFDQQTAVLVDDNYTFSVAAPIVNGTASDLKYAKDISGNPIVKNANYGQPLAFQQPFNGRIGLRLTF